MIQKYYEVSCDYCGRSIYHFLHKPSRKELEDMGCVTTPTKQFCSDICYAEYNHDLCQQRYLNIHPDGKIHELNKITLSL